MERINVTKSFLPPIEEYRYYLDQIWETSHLTNNGPLLREFEGRTEQYLGVDNFHLVTNGTLALQLALKALGITEGEVITTPFSFVATTSSILWERCEPIFVDIEPDTFCIDPDKIETAITAKTKAIMAVHAYGYPCDTEKIEAIAQKHNLKVIYDGAHAFGAKYKGRSLLSYGDITMTSFHATKLFHTIEGGAVIARDKSVSDKVELIKRFGFDGDDYYDLGINAKATEFQAAMGLCNLKYIDGIIAQRKHTSELYDQLLDHKFRRPQIHKDSEYNYIYYPVVVESEEQLKVLAGALGKQNIFARRYFHPSLNTLPYLKTTQSCPISEDISRRVFCLPLYAGLEDDMIRRICEVMNQ